MTRDGEPVAGNLTHFTIDDHFKPSPRAVRWVQKRGYCGVLGEEGDNPVVTGKAAYVRCHECISKMKSAGVM